VISHFSAAVVGRRDHVSPIVWQPRLASVVADDGFQNRNPFVEMYQWRSFCVSTGIVHAGEKCFELVFAYYDLLNVSIYKDTVWSSMPSPLLDKLLTFGRRLTTVF